MTTRLLAVAALLPGLLATAPLNAPAMAGVGDIATIAGGPGRGQALTMGQSPTTVALRGSMLYIADTDANVVRRVDVVTGAESIVAGTGGTGDAGDGGPAAAAELKPSAVAVDGNGNVFIAEIPGPDDGNDGFSRVRKVGTDGTISTIAGGGPSHDEGIPATSAKLSSPGGLAVDGNGNLFIADTGNHVVRRVDTSGTITTYPSAQDPGNTAGFQAPSGLALRGSDLFVADPAAHRVSRIDAARRVTPVAGNGTAPPCGTNVLPPCTGSSPTGDGGPALSAVLSPTGVALDQTGALYIADPSDNRIRRVDATTGLISTYAGNGNAGFDGDGGAATSAQLLNPSGVAVDGSTPGSTYIADQGNHRIRRVHEIKGTAAITTFAGNGSARFGGDGGPATSAQMDAPTYVATDPFGNLFVSDSHNARVRRVDGSGTMSTYAGNGTATTGGDGGPATAASLDPHAIATDGSGNLFIADQGGSRIRKVTTAGVISTFAGTGQGGHAGDGGAANTATFTADGLAADAAGNVYIADSAEGRVRKVDTSGIITTFAGSGPGSKGDGGPATAAQMSPRSLAFGTGGDLLITEPATQRIRRVDGRGIISTLRQVSFVPDGVIAVSAVSGHVFVSGTQGFRVYDVNPDEPGGHVTVTAGDGTRGFGGDGGAATAAEFDRPFGLATDSGGNLFVADVGNNRIRRVTMAPPSSTPPAPRITGIDHPYGTVFGGTPVVISGTGLKSVTGVNFGGNAARNVRVRSDTELEAISPAATPAHHEGEVAVTATGVPGFPPSAASRFRYVDQAWVAGGSLPAVPRTDHTATLLKDGRVLAAGGVTSGGGPTATAELYDPAANHGLGAWTTTGSLGTPRSLHTATLLNGPECTAPTIPSYCGMVLVTGGIGILHDRQQGDHPGALASAELFNPATGTWTPAPPMKVARGDHAATPLGTGKILVSGGQDPDAGSSALPISSPLPNGKAAVIAATEVYDPAAGSWTSAGPMSGARFAHTATLLEGAPCPALCGKVLVAGGLQGLSSDNPLGSAELFDPVSATWAPAPPVTERRARHTTVLLPGGRVLLAGGIGGRTGTEVLASVELFDPTAPSGTFRLTAPLVSARSHHTATLLGGGRCNVAPPPSPCGKVLVAGGLGGAVPPGSPYYQGGSYRPSLRSTELLDPASLDAPGAGAWIPGEDMTVSRVEHATVGLTDGRVVVSGGNTVASDGDPAFPPKARIWASSESFESASGVVAPAISGVDPPVAGTSVTITGRGLYPARSVTVGGRNATIISNSYTTITALLAPLPAGTGAEVVVTTPAGASARAAGTHLTIGAGRWSGTGSMDGCAYSAACEARYGHTATLLDPPGCHTGAAPSTYPCGRVLITGGANDSGISGTRTLTSSELYDPATGGWTSTGSLHEPRVGHVAVLMANGTVLVSGGLVGGNVIASSAELYDPVAGSWSSAGEMSEPRFGHTATLIDGPSCQTAVIPSACGRVLATGGESIAGAIVVNHTADLYDPAANAWAPVQEMTTARFDHTATMLPSGKVLVAGGVGHKGTATCGPPKTLNPPLPAPLGTPQSPPSNEPEGECSESQLRSAELFDIATGTWAATADLAYQRVGHTATLITGPRCQAAQPSPCGKVLVTGGAGNGADIGQGTRPSELYDPGSATWQAAPSVTYSHTYHTSTPLPDGGILVTGSAHAYDVGYEFSEDLTARAAELYEPTGSLGAGHFDQASFMDDVRNHGTATLLDGPACRQATGVPSYCGTVLVAGGQGLQPLGDGCGQCSRAPEVATSALYSPAPRITRLTPPVGADDGGTAVTITGFGLGTVSAVTFGGVPATSFTVDSPNRITAVSPPHPGGPAQVTVVGAGGTSESIEADSAATFTFNGCGTPRAGQIAYPSGVYSLIGLPGGLRVASDSYRYGWFNQGGGNSYTAFDPLSTTTESGHGYWAWFACSRPVTLSGPGVTPSADSGHALSAYHASMVGNPSSTAGAVASGQDFAARWDPALNGYVLSGYREAQSMGVGEGVWIFSFQDSTITIHAAAP